MHMVDNEQRRNVSLSHQWTEVGNACLGIDDRVDGTTMTEKPEEYSRISAESRSPPNDRPVCGRFSSRRRRAGPTQPLSPRRIPQRPLPQGALNPSNW